MGIARANTLECVLKMRRIISVAGLRWRLRLLRPRVRRDRSPIADNTGHSSHSSKPTPSASPTPTVPAFNKKQYSIDDPASLWIVVNKLRPLNPINYTPPLVNVTIAHVYGDQMQAPAAAALAQMTAAMAAAGAGAVEAQSAFRSYSAQASDHAALVARGRPYGCRQ